jgi:creatinine amidohydrolase/Fe(II)-dependent formamide hydrolase-like protein
MMASMKRDVPSRLIGDLTFLDVSKRLRANSILCMPIGSVEQHGPHLPLNTDVVLAEEYTRRIIARWGETYDLWQLPMLAVGLAREHDWAPGTLSLSIQTMTAYMRDLGRGIARNLPTRNLAIINGHGGNRGILEALGQELQADFGLNICVLHPTTWPELDTKAEVPDVHGGKNETSMMLALMPSWCGVSRSRNCKVGLTAALCKRLSSIRPSRGHGRRTRRNSRISASLVMLRQHQRSLGYTCSSRSRTWQALYSSSSWTGSTLRAARTNSGALFWTSLRSHTDILQTLVIAIGLCWSIVFLVVALHFELQLYADGAMFSYAVAVQDVWAFHWHNISARASVFILTLLPC